MNQQEPLIPTLEQARKWYTKSDSVHDFEHVVRVYNIAKRLAIIEHADLDIVLTAALMHDVEDAGPGTDERKTHHLTSAIFAGNILNEMHWSYNKIEAVQHCIRAHRYRDNNDVPETIEAKVLYDSDKLDVLGAIGVARTIAYATIAGEPIYAKPSDQFINSGKEEKGEPHSAYHEYLYKLRNVKAKLFTASAKEIAEMRDKYLTDYFKRLIAEYNGEM